MAASCRSLVTNFSKYRQVRRAISRRDSCSSGVGGSATLIGRGMLARWAMNGASTHITDHARAATNASGLTRAAAVVLASPTTIDGPIRWMKPARSRPNCRSASSAVTQLSIPRRVTSSRHSVTTMASVILRA